MTVALVVNGQTYNYPEEDDEDWGPAATDWASAVTTGMLQKAGGNFTLLADVNFGASFGLQSAYYKTRSSNVATAGNFRLANTDTIDWRNAANSANLALGFNSSDQLTLNGTVLFGTGNVYTVPSSATLTADKLIRGDDGLQGIQTSGIGLDDSDNLTGIVGLVMTGNLVVDTNVLFVDVTANRVGINTASPTVAFQVVGAANISGNLTVDTNTLFVDATNNRVGVGTASPSFTFEVNGSVLATSVAVTTVLNADGTTFYVDPVNHNVGIGTINPTAGYKLDVVGAAKISSDLAVDTNVLFVNASTNRVGINNGSPGAALDVTGAAIISGNLTVDTNTLFVDATNNRVGILTATPSFTLEVNGATLTNQLAVVQTLTVDSPTLTVDAVNHNVGIGTIVPNPSYKLDVTGDVRSTGTMTATQHVSTIAIGTPPLVITSTTLVNNLYVARAVLADSATTNANLTGVITSVGNATSIASQTGTGTKFVVDNTPTLITPNIGAATGTSIALSSTEVLNYYAASTSRIVAGNLTNDNGAGGISSVTVVCGYITRVGKEVWITLQADFTMTTATGELRVALPFTISSATRQFVGTLCSVNNNGAAASVGAILLDTAISTAYFRVRATQAGAAFGTGSNSTVSLQLYYQCT